MSYTALYRKFRPDQFGDVKGQEPIVNTLKNQIKADRIGHAYLFCGTRGTGKTTIAKIFAKSVNCLNPVEGSPCGICQSCKTIAAGASMNVIEIDAASNNGVDNIREIVDEVSYSPAEGKYKVYIIDEVHMLSIGAFNALLKTLEEPPAYVIFILATTEVHKIPITILSRCQRYDFKRISIDIIADRLRELVEKENIEIDEKALRYIAKTADGSLRDALSLLDQCIAFYFENKLTYDSVLDVLGAVDTSVFSRLLRYVLEQKVLACIELLEEIVMQGRELTQFVTDFTWYLRNLMLCKTSEHIEDVIDVSTDNLTRLKEEANMAGIDTIMRYIRVFSELSGQMKYASQKRILLEMGLIRLCKPEMETSRDSLIDRVRVLEDKMEKGMIPVREDESGNTSGNENQSSVKRESVPLPKAIPEDVKKMVQNWVSIAGSVEMPLKKFLKEAKLSLGGDNRLMLVFEDEIAFAYLTRDPETKARVEKLLSNSIGKEIEINVQSVEPNRKFEDSYVDLSRLINMDIEIEEE